MYFVYPVKNLMEGIKNATFWNNQQRYNSRRKKKMFLIPLFGRKKPAQAINSNRIALLELFTSHFFPLRVLAIQ